MTGTSPKIVSQKEALQNLVLDGDLERLEDLLAEFNLFDVLKIERREAQHSALLAWLLDPRGSHGLRDYFLRRFLSQAAAKAYEREITDITPLDVDRWNLDNIEVVTERHNIDILLIGEADEFVCHIENKIGAGEHSDQLARYFSTVESEYQGLAQFPIFLTPDGRDPESEDDAGRYVPFDYSRVAGLIERTLQTRGSTISSSVAGFLEQYARTLRRHVLASTPIPPLRCPRGCGDPSPPQSPPSFPRRASPREDGGGNPSPVAASLVDAHSIPSSNYLTLAIPIPPVYSRGCGNPSP